MINIATQIYLTRLQGTPLEFISMRYLKNTSKGNRTPKSSMSDRLYTHSTSRALEIYDKFYLPWGQFPQKKDPGTLIQGTGGFAEHAGRLCSHSFTSTVHAGFEFCGSVVQPYQINHN